MLRNLAGLHFEGIAIDWNACQPDRRAVCPACLPTRGKHERFWLECESSRRHRLAKIEHPLLGLRQEAPDPTWEFLLDPRYFKYLDDHRFWDSVVFPAAGYGEIGLAVRPQPVPPANPTSSRT